MDEGEGVWLGIGLGLEQLARASALCEHDRAHRLLRGLDARTLTKGHALEPPLVGGHLRRWGEDHAGRAHGGALLG